MDEERSLCEERVVDQELRHWLEGQIMTLEGQIESTRVEIESLSAEHERLAFHLAVFGARKVMLEGCLRKCNKFP